MKLIGNLKKQVENEGSKEGRKKLIEKAGMLLTDDELDRVAGGSQINATSGPHSVFGLFSEHVDPQFVNDLVKQENETGALSYQAWQYQHPNATEEEIRAFWESYHGNG